MRLLSHVLFVLSCAIVGVVILEYVTLEGLVLILCCTPILLIGLGAFKVKKGR